MNPMRITMLVALVAGAMLVGAIVGATAHQTNLVGAFAAAASPSPQTSAGTGKAGSNEDATHEKGESTAREAAEDSGQLRGGPGGPGHGPNEDATHEQGESADREAAENAGQRPSPAPTAKGT